MYKDLRANDAFSYEAIEKMFEDHQSKWPETIFNEDAYYKYIAPLIDECDGSYLEMALGSKTEQRKWWLYNRLKFTDSKYLAGNALSDIITLRAYNKADITVTPYADIYVSIKYGSKDSGTQDVEQVSRKTPRNTSVTIPCPLDRMNDTEVYIYSSSQLASVGDLSPLLVGYANFSYATKLQSLKLGDADPNYNNPNLENLTLGNNTLLKTLDVRNCSNYGDKLTTPPDLSGCKNIEHIYFDGTAIKGVKLPNGGIIKTLHLPGTITNLEIINQPNITDFVLASEENLTTVTLENIGNIIDTKTLVNGLTEGSNLRLIGFDWTVADETELLAIKAKLDSLHGRNEQGLNVDTAQVYGTIHIDTVSGAVTKQIKDKYPDITIDYNTINCTVRFYNYDGTSVLQTKTSANGAAVTYTGSTPTKPQSASHTFTFANGWARYVDGVMDPDALKNVTEDRDLYPVFTSQLRTFTVTFKNWDNNTLQTVNNVPYGGSANYTETTPTNNSTGNTDDYLFTGWSPEPINIVGNLVCVAQYADASNDVTKYIRGKLEIYETINNSTIADSGLIGQGQLTKISGPFTYIGPNGLNSCSNLKTVEFTQLDNLQFNTDNLNAQLRNKPIKHLVIHSSTVAEINDVNAISGTFIEKKLGAIYVRPELLDLYRSHITWGKYMIAPLDSYPLGYFEDISDDWDTIISNINSGNVDKYPIGSIKTIEADGQRYQTMLIGVDKDILSDNDASTAKTTWAFRTTVFSHRAHSVDEAVPYSELELRSVIKSFKSKLPTIIQSNIKTVKKVTKDPTGTDITSDEDIWLFSSRELGLRKSASAWYQIENSGAVYDQISNVVLRIKYTTSGSSVPSFW